MSAGQRLASVATEISTNGRVVTNMDMGFKNAFDDLLLGGGIVGLLCVLPMFILLVIVIVVVSLRRSDNKEER